MSGVPRIESVMTPFVISVEIDETLRIAENRMIDNEVRDLAVTDSEMLVGVVSDRDLAFLANSPEADLRERLRVRDVCSLDLYTVTADEALDGVLEQIWPSAKSGGRRPFCCSIRFGAPPGVELGNAALSPGVEMVALCG